MALIRFFITNENKKIDKNRDFREQFSFLPLLITHDDKIILRFFILFRLCEHEVRKNQPILCEQCSQRIAMTKNFCVTSQCSNIHYILKITSNSHHRRKLLPLLPNCMGGSCHPRSCCRLPVPETLKVLISTRMTGSRERIDSANVDQLLSNHSFCTIMAVKQMIQWGYA